MSELMSDIARKSTVLLMALLLAVPAAAATREERRVADAADVLDQLLRIPERSIPPALLSRAYAVAVIPNVVKSGFGVGARRGRGLRVVRHDETTGSADRDPCRATGIVDAPADRLRGEIPQRDPPDLARHRCEL